MNTVNHDLTSYITLIENKLEALIPSCSGADACLYEAARYALLGGGKRIRPILTLATAKLFNADIEAALVPACAIEMIHTYSVIHDDLPCMDDDDFRRGKPSLHKQFDEALAVLTGDFLLTRAFEVISEDRQLNVEMQIDLIRTIACASGGKGMIGGQVIDISSEGKGLDLKQLQHLHAKKTGALITAAVECGCIVASASDEERQPALQFAQDIGLAFQIVDDLLDITSGVKKRGAEISSDRENNKSTYVALLGIEEARKSADQLFNNAIKSLDQLSQETEFLKELAHFIIKRDH